MLAPKTRSVRVKRARTVVAYTQCQHEKYLKGLQAWAAVPDPNTANVLARVRQRIKELEMKRAADNQKAELNTTEMIREAAASIFSPDQTKEVLLAWQEASGAAHGLVWQILGQPSTTQAGPADKSGLAPFRAVGSFDRIANPFMAAFHLSDRGWKLLGQRGL